MIMLDTLPMKYRRHCFILAYKRTSQAAQLDKLIEEMSELTQAIMKTRYNQNTVYDDHILEEMGHVELCLEMIRSDLSPCMIDKLELMKDERIRNWYNWELSLCGGSNR